MLKEHSFKIMTIFWFKAFSPPNPPGNQAAGHILPLRMPEFLAGVARSGPLCLDGALAATGGSTEQLCSVPDPVSISDPQ